MRVFGGLETGTVDMRWTKMHYGAVEVGWRKVLGGLWVDEVCDNFCTGAGECETLSGAAYGRGSGGSVWGGVVGWRGRDGGDTGRRQRPK